jgi:uncharacterized protein involved in cysteine biosynthesis
MLYVLLNVLVYVKKKKKKKVIINTYRNSLMFSIQLFPAINDNISPIIIICITLYILCNN